MTATRITDDHVVVPASVDGSLVVTFDDQYVWSFSPRRDGVRRLTQRFVPWPPALRSRLDGTVRVRVAEGEHVHFDDAVSFGSGDGSISITDRHGHPLAVDRAGHLMRVFEETSEESRRRVVEGTARAIADLQDIGVTAHVSYGTLLGAVREGRVLGHDTDTDLAYLSRHTHPADVVRESYRVERALRERGWKVVRMSSADLKLFHPLDDGRDVQVDVFCAFHVEGVFYQMGARSGQLPTEAVLPLSEVLLEGVPVAAPADPERVLAFLYGESWRVPDPAFQNVDPGPGVRRIDGWMRGVRTHLADWNVIFRTRRKELPHQGSAFASWTKLRIPDDAVVVDLGSGIGRDSGYFTRRGHRVVAADYSGAALRQSQTRMVRRGATDPEAWVLPFNDLRAVLLAGAELARLPGPPVLYARQLVGCLDDDARHHLWVLASMALRRGGALFLEVAEGRHRSRDQHALVQRVVIDDLVAEIARAGGRVVHVERCEGEDTFGHPDPHVARLEVRWAPDPATPGGPVFDDVVSEADSPRRQRLGRALSVPARLRDLEASIQENRRLSRRVAELTDVVAELLVPLAERDEEKAQEAIARFRALSFEL